MLEARRGPGGKMREVDVAGARIDAGPTVLTMRWAFEGIFEDAGARFRDSVVLEPRRRSSPATPGRRSRLDLYADIDRTAEAIGASPGRAKPRAIRASPRGASAIYETLRRLFMPRPRPGPSSSLAARVGLARMPRNCRASRRSRRCGARSVTFPRSETAPTVRPLRHLLRLVALPRAGDPDADRPCRARGRMAGRRRHARGSRRARRLAEARGASSATQRASRRSLVEQRARQRRAPRRTASRSPPTRVVVQRRRGALAARALVPEARAPAPRRPRPRCRPLTLAMVGRGRAFRCRHHNVFFATTTRPNSTKSSVAPPASRAHGLYLRAGSRRSAGDDRSPERLFCLVNAPPRGGERYHLGPRRSHHASKRRSVGWTPAG